MAFCAAIVSAAMALLTEQKFRCLDAVHFSTLQLYSGINVRPFSSKPWMKDNEMPPNYTFHLHLAIPPLLSAVVSCSRLYLHKSSGGRNPSFIRFLIGVISSSTLVVLCQLSGALVLLIMDKRATITLRYGILLMKSFFFREVVA
ncbi:hypothetical protein IQ07DRAFT_606633 [Pyrenochaeta sp. DS3sAY3a]|nr:hypothetical protein IQ07DRAFT_606633 [Pyrenochaeta sp. DS3sAY3a]